MRADLRVAPGGYVIPACPLCDTPRELDRLKVYLMSIFCPNEKCTEYLLSRWYDKKTMDRIMVGSGYTTR